MYWRDEYSCCGCDTTASSFIATNACSFKTRSCTAHAVAAAFIAFADARPPSLVGATMTAAASSSASACATLSSFSATATACRSCSRAAAAAAAFCVTGRFALPKAYEPNASQMRVLRKLSPFFIARLKSPPLLSHAFFAAARHAMCTEMRSPYIEDSRAVSAAVCIHTNCPAHPSWNSALCLM